MRLASLVAVAVMMVVNFAVADNGFVLNKMSGTSRSLEKRNRERAAMVSAFGQLVPAVQMFMKEQSLSFKDDACIRNFLNKHSVLANAGFDSTEPVAKIITSDTNKVEAINLKIVHEKDGAELPIEVTCEVIDSHFTY